MKSKRTVEGPVHAQPPWTAQSVPTDELGQPIPARKNRPRPFQHRPGGDGLYDKPMARQTASCGPGISDLLLDGPMPCG